MESSMFVLQPTFAENAEPISLFPALTRIGREEPELLRFGDAYLEGLEVRHARIIREDGAPQLVDLSESGATLRNGDAVGAVPVRLEIGDLLRFGSKLEFRVLPMAAEVLQATRLMTEGTPALELQLTPTAEQGPPAPIVVSDFPFLVSSSDGHFSTYQSALPDPVSFLSRRHAHVYQSEGKLLLEDLGSTNGTKHNGEPVKDRPVTLTTGDEVRFGHRSFTFQVTITEQSVSSALAERPLPEGTIMISSAGSYLDVYCDDGADDAAAAVADQEPAAGTPAVGDLGLGALRRSARVRWQELPFPWARQIGVFVLLPVLLIGLTVVSVTRDTRLKDAQSLLDQGQPQEALVTAVDYLTENPASTTAARLVASAFEAAVLPGWIERMQGGQAGAALDLLAEQVALAPSMADSRVTGLLRWMTELEAFLAPADGAVAVDVGSENRRLKALASRWRSEDDSYTQVLRRLTDAHAELAPVHARAMSSIRTIQGEGADQLQAVRQLHTRVSELIDQSQFEAASSWIAQFAAEHPQLRGFDDFNADLDRLMAISAARSEQDLERFLSETEDLSFTTAFFGKFMSRLSLERRQALEVQQQLQQAAALWGEGKLEPAQEALAPQVQSPWRRVVELRQARYRTLQQGFVELLAQVGTSDYPDAVINFYVQLDAEEDEFMYQALADDFTNQRDRALANAEQLASEGERLWSGYKQRFQGIGGGLRLEGEVSDTYRELASQLTDSVGVLQRAQRLYRILDKETPPRVLELREEAEQEVIRQRSALTDLRYVLGEALVQQKLDLLPSLEGRS